MTPIKPKNLGGGGVAVDVELAGIKVRPGDWGIADDDGIVIWPRDRLDELKTTAAELDRAGQRAVNLNTDRLSG